MKKLLTLLSTIGLLFTGCFLSFAQTANQPEPKKELTVQRLTVMEQYEPELVLSSEERLRLKKERLALMKNQRNTIDTLQISDRKRRKLLVLIYKNPHSDLLAKTVNSHFIDQEE